MRLLQALSLFLAFGASAGARACPRGLSGPGCDRPAWPSCTVAGIQGDCRTPNTCDCFRECDAHGFLHREARICYNATAPSSVDDLASAKPLLFRTSIRLVSGAPDCGNACDHTADDQPIQPDSKNRVVPLHLCPNRCSGRGFCFADERCRCFLIDGSTTQDANSGDDCSGAVGAKPCPNACSGAGTCANGVCVCERGRSGADCGLPLKLALATRPRIFVYEIPPAFNAWQDLVAVDRNTGWHLWQAFLRSEHRTTDPAQADFFFIPVWPMGTFGMDTAMLAFEHVIRSEPHWNSTSGLNHLVVFPYDFAACQIVNLPYFHRIRVIGHYGLTEGGPHFCDPPHGGPGHRPGVDVLVPDTMEMLFKKRSPYLTGEDVWSDRPTKFFFAGARSGPARARLFDMNVRHDGYRILEGHVDLASEMRAAVYCGDFGAAGFSTRFALAVVMGCVPVWLDEQLPAWAETLPVDDFSIRLTRHEFVSGKLAEVVDAVTPGRLSELRAAGRAAWRRYVWNFMGIDVGPHDAEELLYERLSQLVQ